MKEASSLEKRPVVFAAPNFCCIFSAHRSETRAAAKASVDGVMRKVWRAKDLGAHGAGPRLRTAKK